MSEYDIPGLTAAAPVFAATARRGEAAAGAIARLRATQHSARARLPLDLSGLDARLRFWAEEVDRSAALLHRTATEVGDADRRAALELADVLGGLPLALEQAAAYVQASGESLAGYASLFWRRRADLLRRGEPIGSTETVATTWRLAFEGLQQASPGAAGLLRLLAFCAPAAPAAAAPPGPGRAARRTGGGTGAAA